MATMGLSESTAGVSRCKFVFLSGDYALARRVQPVRSGFLAVGVLAFAASSSAFAQRWTIEPGVSSRLTWTSNSLLGTANAQGDTILDVRPSITIRGEGARLRVAGTVALNGVTYLGGTQPSRVLPEGDLTARLEPVERLLFLEGAVRSSQTSTDPFGVRPEGATTSNTLTTTQARFSPYVESSIGPLTRYRS